MALLLAIALPLSVTGHVSGELTPNRLVTVTAHTAPGATCALADSLTGIRLSRTASSAGRATWRWRPSVWSSGSDVVSIRCAKGAARRSTEYFMNLGEVGDISVIRDYALHLVYWGDIPAEVQSAVSQLETDVKASLDAGALDNPFAIPRAYGDSLGGGDPRIASIDSTVMADPFRKATEGYCSGVSTPCIGSPDVGNEVTRLGHRYGWAAGNHSLIVIFTPPSLTVCYSRAPCTAQREVCGYHALTSAGYAYGQVTLSAAGRQYCGRTDASLFAVQTLEHEQDEVIVDPWGYGLEVADPCETDFSSVPINGHSYLLQSILDNDACAFGYTP